MCGVCMGICMGGGEGGVGQLIGGVDANNF
jgi:hypothetical protein